MKSNLIAFCILLTINSLVYAQSDQDVKIEAGAFLPFYSLSGDSVNVPSFYMDKYPVTNQEFLEFVTENPKWQRSKIKSVFAGDDYLKHWAGDLDLGENSDKLKNSPVTNVSWFAARAYAKWKGRRLPTLDEWEYVASASETKALASRDTSFQNKILDWYSKPNPETHPSIGQNKPNYHGVYDLHGLVWEWVQDFNTVFVSGESRADQDKLNQFYCAAGSTAASDEDKANYVAFLRYSLRGSLAADYSIGNLGFRTAKSIDNDLQ